MTKEGLLAVINDTPDKYNGVLGLFFDNDVVEYYLLDKSNPDDSLTESNIVTLGGEDMIKIPVMLANKVNGRRDILGHRYAPIDMIQAVITIDNAKDIERLDVNKFFVN